jgi:hypothetical protein
MPYSSSPLGVPFQAEPKPRLLSGTPPKVAPARQRQRSYRYLRHSRTGRREHGARTVCSKARRSSGRRRTSNGNCHGRVEISFETSSTNRGNAGLQPKGRLCCHQERSASCLAVLPLSATADGCRFRPLDLSPPLAPARGTPCDRQDAVDKLATKGAIFSARTCGCFCDTGQERTLRRHPYRASTKVHVKVEGAPSCVAMSSAMNSNPGKRWKRRPSGRMQYETRP